MTEFIEKVGSGGGTRTPDTRIMISSVSLESRDNFVNDVPDGPQDAETSPAAVNRETAEMLDKSPLDLALMPDYLRKFTLRYMPNPPSEAEIHEAWLEWHGKADGERRIYFVQRGDGPIKIGIAKNPAKRIASLQTACAEYLTTHILCPGDLAMEREYHRQFAKWRLAGEWFEPVPAIFDEIDRLRAFKKELRAARKAA